MASTFSSNLRLELMATGEKDSTWGQIANDNVFELLEDAIAGYEAISVAAGNVTLSSNNGSADQARKAFLKFTGAPGAARTVTAPAVSKLYLVWNASDSVVTVAAGGVGVAIPSGARKWIVCDGTDFYEAAPSVGPTTVVASTDAGASAGPFLVLDRNSASPAAADVLGEVVFRGRDGGGAETDYAKLRAELIDPTNGSEDGSLHFYTMIAGTLAERMKCAVNGKWTINSPPASGDTLQVNNGISGGNALVLIASGSGGRALFASTGASSNQAIQGEASDSSTYTDAVFKANAHRTANSNYSFFRAFSGNDTDLEFTLRGDGTGLCDGSWTGGGADYAEMFEWSDGNPAAADRAGLTVVLVGDKVRPAQAGETPIGVVSANPTVIGNNPIQWPAKYERDDFGRRNRARINQAFDQRQVYVPRSERAEWAKVGFMGRLPVRKGQPVAPAWIKLRDVSAHVEEWLVR
jgi:hypothetical protein